LKKLEHKFSNLLN
jgi:hypothetical protein